MVRRVAHRAHRRRDFWRYPACGLVGNAPIVHTGHGALQTGVMLEHRIEDGEQLAHHGGQRDFGGFAALPQAAVKGGSGGL